LDALLAWLESAFRHYYSPERTNHLGGSGCLFRKSTFKEAGGFDSTYALAEDMELCTRLANKGYTLLLIKKPLIYIRVRSNLYKHILSQVRKIAYMVMIYFKMRGVKRIARTYSRPTDYIQGLLPIACLIFLASIPFLSGQHLLIGLCTMLLILLVVNIKFARFIYFNRSKAELSMYWPAIFVFYIILRSLSWAVGLIYGIWLVIINHARGYPSAANQELLY
jgi:cellulose synthase/poly-beta-1,6-N-acetylglucosamine synthase-like glycosyltransferase